MGSCHLPFSAVTDEVTDATRPIDGFMSYRHLRWRHLIRQMTSICHLPLKGKA